MGQLDIFFEQQNASTLVRPLLSSALYCMLPYCGPYNVLTVCITKCRQFQLMLTCASWKKPHVLWPHATIWEVSVNRLQSATLMCVQRAQRKNSEIEVILVWTQLLTTACVGQNSHSSVLHSVLNKDLCLFRVSSVALHHNRAPADYLWLRGGQWFMTVFLLLYTSSLLQFSAAVNLSKLPQRRENRELRISSSLESIGLSAKRWKCSFRKPNE